MNGGESGRSQTKTEAERRAERLRAALRENLKRRKAQARGRAAPGDEPAAASHDSAGVVRDKPER